MTRSQSPIVRGSAELRGRGAPRRGDSLRESRALPEVTAVDNSAGRYPTEAWEATYFSVNQRGTLSAQRLTVLVPAGLSDVCPRVQIGQLGCVYAVRRWGFALRPSVLEAAGLDLTPLLTEEDKDNILQAILSAAAFDLPGEFIIASPEHPFRLVAPDGTLRGSSMQWRTYLGALTFFVSEGQIDADFFRLWAEARQSYHLAVDLCLVALQATAVHSTNSGRP
jgi:hypothetical protein